jgi:hypothetical protein
MKDGDSSSLLERYSKLREDSLYREDTYEFTNRLELTHTFPAKTNACL